MKAAAVQGAAAAGLATGCESCCFSLWCHPCASGSVASAAGRDYCVSCCLIPAFVPCYAPCHIACADRSALAAKYGVEDDIAGCAACAFYTFVPCGAVCIVAQELNEIKLSQPLGAQYVFVTQQQQQTAMMMQPQAPPQMQMMSPPPGYPAANYGAAASGAAGGGQQQPYYAASAPPQFQAKSVDVPSGYSKQ